MTTTQLDPRKNTLDKKGNLRVDFLFSYWLMAWFLIYYFTPNSTQSQSPISAFIRKHLNPKLGFYLAILENLVTITAIIFYGTDGWTIFKFGCMIFIFKIFPLYLLRDYTVHWGHDSFVLVCVFVIYNIYLAFNETNIYEIYERTFFSIKHKRNETPLFSLVHRIFHV